MNYKWQIWETNAFSLYTTGTAEIDKEGAVIGVESMLQFMKNQGILLENPRVVKEGKIVDDTELVSIRIHNAGLFESYVTTGAYVKAGDLLANVIDPYDGEIRDRILAPQNGCVFFAYDKPLVYANTAVFKLIESNT